MQDLRAAEAVFEEEINAQTAKLADFGEIDLVIGIPFYNEDALGLAIQELQAGLAAYCPEASVVIACVGSPAGEQALARLNSFKSVVEDPRICAFLLQDRQLYGKGWGVKALLKIAAYLHSDLVILEADFPVLLQGQSSSRWLELLADPVRKYRYDLVLGCFERHPFADALATDLISPVLAATYGWSIPDPHGDELALSNSLVNRLLAKQLIWSSDAYQYGVGIWLLTTALAEELRVCCANLGSKMTREYSGKRENMAHQILRTLLQQVQLHYPKWSKQGAILRSPGTLGLPDTKEQVTKQPGLTVALSKFRRGFDASTAELFKQVLAPEVYAKLNFLAEAPPAEAEFSDQLWLEIVFSFLLASAFRTEFAADDLVQGLLCLLHGRRAYQEPTQQVRFFHYWRGTLVEEWQQLAESSQPVLPQVAFWEFIPGVPMTLPQEVTSSSGKVVSLIPIYEALIREYRQRFATFVQDRLGLEDVTVSVPIVQGVTEFMTWKRGLRNIWYRVILPRPKGWKRMFSYFSTSSNRNRFLLLKKRSFSVSYMPTRLLTY